MLSAFAGRQVRKMVVDVKQKQRARVEQKGSWPSQGRKRACASHEFQRFSLEAQS